MRDLFRFYIKSSIHVALSAFSISIWSTSVLNKTFNFSLSIGLFFASLSFYNWVKYKDLSRSGFRRSKNLFLAIFGASILSFGIALGLFIKEFTGNQWIVLGISSALGLLYGSKTLKGLSRENGRIKPFIVATVWMLLTAVLPGVSSSGLSFSEREFLWFAAVWLWIMALMVPFEIRDAKEDHLVFPSLAQRWGSKNLKLLGVFCLSGSLFLMGMMRGLTPAFILSIIVMGTTTGLSILIANDAHSEYVTSFWIEAIPILSLGVYLLSSTMLA